MAAAAAQAAPVPQRLLRFFARYPPNLYSAKHTGLLFSEIQAKLQARTRSPESQSSSQPSLQPSLQPLPQALPQTSDDSHSTTAVSSASIIKLSDSNEPSAQPTTVAPPSQPSTSPPNPFLPWKNPETGSWRGAAVGLRRQAELVKIAKKHGVEALLPPGRKSTEFKEHRILEKGLRVRGTGEGQKVKGHKWERTLDATLEKRRKAMEEMPELIREWKQRGHGRGWKKYPRGKATR